MISVRMAGGTRSVYVQIDGMPHGFEAGLYSALQDVGGALVKEERRLERRRDKTGRLYWFRGGWLRASAPGEVPQWRTGRLARGTDSNVKNHLQMEFGQEAYYARFLALGTSRMEPRANLQQAVKNKAGMAGKIIEQHVNREAGI